MTGQNSNRVLRVKGRHVCCCECGLVHLGNKTSIGVELKLCKGLKNLENEEYFRVKRIIGDKFGKNEE